MKKTIRRKAFIVCAAMIAAVIMLTGAKSIADTLNPAVESGLKEDTQMVIHPNHPNRMFTFSDRGEEISELYRKGLENNPDHIPYFCEKLKSDNPEVREAAVAQLLFTHDERAVDPLIGVMTDPSTKIRRGAIAALRRIGSKNAIPALKESLNFVPPEPEFDPDILGKGYMRKIAMMGRQDINRRKNAPESEPDLSEYEYCNRIAAAYALHELGDPAGKETILRMMKEGEGPGGMVQDAAIMMNLTEAGDFAVTKLKEEGITTGYLLLLRNLNYEGPVPEEVLESVIEFDKHTHQVAKFQTFAFFSKYGDERVIPVFREYLEGSNDDDTKPLNLYAIAEALKRLKGKESADLLIQYLITPKTDSQGRVRGSGNVRVFEVACEALAEMPDTEQLDTLKKLYALYEQPVDFFMNRLYVAWVIAAWGDSFGKEKLVEGLNHDDAAVRRIAFKLLTKLNDPETHDMLYGAVKREPETYTFLAMKQYLDAIGLLNKDIKSLPTPQNPLPEDRFGKPRFVQFNFDDCATVYAMERFADFVEEMAVNDARWVCNITWAPLAKYDDEYNQYLVQRMFDRGCEVSNHTLHHNHPPADSHLTASDDQTLRAEIGGCTNWLKSHIKSLDKVYHWHPGGGGYFKPGQKRRTIREIAAIAREAGLEKDIEYEELAGTEKVEYVDPYAPAYHETINAASAADASTRPPLYPYRDQKDLDLGYAADEAWERIDAFAASFEHWYFNAPDKVMFFMGHDFTNGPVQARLAHEKHWDILKGFIKEVFLTKRDRYPLAYCATHLELAHVFNGGANIDELLERTSHLQTR